MSDSCTPLVFVEADGTPIRYERAYLLNDPRRRDRWSIVLVGLSEVDVDRLSASHHLVAKSPVDEVYVGRAWVEAGGSTMRVRLVGSGILEASPRAA